MMPQKDWNTINDDWAEHDFTAGSGRKYPLIMAQRYGKIANLADFVRKSQMMNYEGYRAMYEGREAQLFNPVQGILTWMSHPAQPSFVWQIYHYDLEPNAAFFGVKNACEPVHIQLNDAGNGTIQVINHLPTALSSARTKCVLYNLDGSSPYQHDYDVTAAASAATSLGTVEWPTGLSPVHFVRLELRDASGRLLSDNFYWCALSAKPDDLTALDTLRVMTLDAQVKRRDAAGKVFLDVTLKNPGPQVALMARLQLHRGTSKERVLPAYYTDNYISLVPQEEKVITIEAAVSDFKGEKPLVWMDGWNIGLTSFSSPAADVAINENASVDHWPQSGLPFAYAKLEPGKRCASIAAASRGTDSKATQANRMEAPDILPTRLMQMWTWPLPRLSIRQVGGEIPPMRAPSRHNRYKPIPCASTSLNSTRTRSQASACLTSASTDDGC